MRKERVDGKEGREGNSRCLLLERKRKPFIPTVFLESLEGPKEGMKLDGWLSMF